jgi:hypothetical protein
MGFVPPSERGSLLDDKLDDKLAEEPHGLV